MLVMLVMFLEMENEKILHGSDEHKCKLFIPLPRSYAYLENFDMDEDKDWLGGFEVGRDEDENPKYCPMAPSFLDIEDEMFLARAIENMDWCSEGHSFYKKTKGDDVWHAKSLSGRNFTRGFKTKATKRKLFGKFTSEDILKFDPFLD
ncbi:hypothetical protein Tco_1325643 [Tanacetum coccineum]